ncbi:hypothetical protein [Micromonospora sp. 067-2]|uniref:DoxX family protein n=1 Tax=Micromonospora sp. 067-2 TaxID=2789270 RepID=UPI00397B8B04
MSRSTTPVLRALGQAALGALLLTTGTGHLTTKRREFRAQVPSWLPADPDKVVVASGFVEIALGSALLATWRQPARRLLGTAVAGFFVGVFPGNIAQYVERRDGFGLDTDRKRALRLLGQPALVAWALAATRDRPR